MRASLIVTTYNRPDALHLVLQSVLQQTVPPAEIIVADDGSGADTAETVGRFAKTSPIPVKHVWQEDQGFRAAQSRNRALAAAQGPYMVLIPNLSPTTWPWRGKGVGCRAAACC